jgi:hypothetical protein
VSAVQAGGQIGRDLDDGAVEQLRTLNQQGAVRRSAISRST